MKHYTSAAVLWSPPAPLPSSEKATLLLCAPSVTSPDHSGGSDCNCGHSQLLWCLHDLLVTSLTLTSNFRMQRCNFPKKCKREKQVYTLWLVDLYDWQHSEKSRETHRAELHTAGHTANARIYPFISMSSYLTIQASSPARDCCTN